MFQPINYSIILVPLRRTKTLRSSGTEKYERLKLQEVSLYKTNGNRSLRTASGALHVPGPTRECCQTKSLINQPRHFWPHALSQEGLPPVNHSLIKALAPCLKAGDSPYPGVPATTGVTASRGTQGAQAPAAAAGPGDGQGAHGGASTAHARHRQETHPSP